MKTPITPKDPEQPIHTMQNPKSSFQWRALTSVVVSMAFLALAVSGIVLWAAPPGRIANWTDWSMLGLRKSQWIDLHIWFSLLFVVASIFHLILNWRPLMSYFKNKATRQFGWRREWLAGVLLCGALFAAVRLELPPFSSFLVFTDTLRESWDIQNDRPPIPHAELLTLGELAEKAGIEVTNALSVLESRGIRGAAPDLRMGEIAKQNRLPAQRIYEIMVGSTNHGERRSGQGPGGQGGGGAGRKTLSEFCIEEGIDLKAASARLEANGIKFTPRQTLREIAVNNGYQRPNELVRMIRGN
ncbi:MAG TPA: DUF4405 domain-containing protein [Candidatus Paceibacterota bacterium]|nr:DUF4405 domain-containing protein [Verrucomicrobiota bacterium]HRY50180.1 DUF4405 domain-containing protein [Candidatus Paceibacterota bacterium]HSA02317.1 DUF4405 domain-containing protein [Candidatus Paceibacterota bacterium]